MTEPQEFHAMSNKGILAFATLLAVVVAGALAASAQMASDRLPTLQAVAQQTVPAQIPGRAMGSMPMMGRGMGEAMMYGMMGGPGTMGFGGMMFDHVEGRIAFLRTELKITEAQTGAWNTFADALRASAKRMGEARQAMMRPDAAPANIVERLDARERMLSAALESTRAMKASFAALNAKLSDEQKKTADELFAFRMGPGMTAFTRNSSAR
jgi:hypothetical protein